MPNLETSLKRGLPRFADANNKVVYAAPFKRLDEWLCWDRKGNVSLWEKEDFLDLYSPANKEAEKLTS
jgi:hypothetical protein